MKAILSEDWKRECLFYWHKVLDGKYAHWCQDWDELPIEGIIPQLTPQSSPPILAGTGRCSKQNSDSSDGGDDPPLPSYRWRSRGFIAWPLLVAAVLFICGDLLVTGIEGCPRLCRIATRDVSNAKLLWGFRFVTEKFVRVPTPNVEQVLPLKNFGQALSVGGTLEGKHNVLSSFCREKRPNCSLGFGEFPRWLVWSIGRQRRIFAVRRREINLEVMRVSMTSIGERENRLRARLSEISPESAYNNSRAFSSFVSILSDLIGFLRRFEKTISQCGVNDDCEECGQFQPYLYVLAAAVLFLIGATSGIHGFYKIHRDGAVVAIAVALTCSATATWCATFCFLAWVGCHQVPAERVIYFWQQAYPGAKVADEENVSRRRWSGIANDGLYKGILSPAQIATGLHMVNVEERALLAAHHFSRDPSLIPSSEQKEKGYCERRSLDGDSFEERFQRAHWLGFGALVVAVIVGLIGIILIMGCADSTALLLSGMLLISVAFLLSQWGLDHFWS